MTNDEVYQVLKREGIKEAIRGYIANQPKDEWTIFTNEGNVFLLNDNFLVKYSLNPIFEKDMGELFFKEWQTWRYPKGIIKKRMREKALT